MSKANRRRQLKNAAPMIRVVEESHGAWPGPEPTLENLLKHYDKYGWSRSRKRVGRSYGWIDNTYRTYKQMRNDVLVEVARAYLDRDDYLELVATLGKPEFIEQAIELEGWEDEDHGEQSRADVRPRGHSSEPTGVVRNDGYDGTDAIQVRGQRKITGGARIKGQVPNPFTPAIRR